MVVKSHYEERIFRELQTLPDEALPKVARLIGLIREEFLCKETSSEAVDDAMDHQRTRRALASSQRNWAHDIVVDREDRA